MAVLSQAAGRWRRWSQRPGWRTITWTAPSPSVQRLRLAAVGLAITLLVFTQSSGLIAADTKLDLVVAPWRFLVTAATAWDPTADAGTLQNQAYGYLFPMGPFFLLGYLAHVPAWIVQRTWESALLVGAFLGTFRLSRLLGVAGWWPRVAAGLTYALAPRMLMEIGIISSELLPVVALPWVLIPLVQGAREGSPRRAAALSGIALLFAGGTNAAATLAILPVPVLWLLTRERGPRRAALARWWTLAVALSCLWWTVPLLVLGKYSPPFLNWIESAAVTTSPTSLATTLRGAEHWEAYLGSNVWPAGYIFVTQRTVVFATAVVAAAGLIGISLRRTRNRFFLGTCLAAGLVLTTFGHVASIGPLAAMTERTSLDGALNAFRNIHKFDPVLRLPIAIGVGQLVAAGIERWGRRARQPRPGRADPLVTGTVAALCIAVAAIAPALTGTLIPELHAVNDPSWWHQAADWLGDQGDGRALVVPGAAQPIYLWGSPRDDALQPLATSPWTVRDSIPLANAGYIRLLDEVDAELAAGQADPSLAEVLARSGIRYVVVRNDLDTTASDATPLQFVYSTLDNSAGFRKVKSFGPNLISGSNPNELTDSGALPPSAAITVYADTAWTGDVALLPTSQAVVANGSADNLADLTAAGVSPDQPVIFAPAELPPGAGPPSTALTDGIRRREFAFGGIGGYSATMTANQPYTLARAAHDYLPTPSPPLSTTSYLGIKDVLASSSGASANAAINVSAANGPWSALDGNLFTAWRVGAYAGAIGQWLQVDLAAQLDLSTASIAFAGLANGYPDRIRVTTAAGRLDQTVVPDGLPQTIRLPAGETGFVRITLLHMADGSSGRAAGIAELSIPGVLAARTLDVPGSGRPDLVAFSLEAGNRSDCLTVNAAPACDPAWSANGEEDGSLDRTFTLSGTATYDTRALVTLRPGAALNQVLDRGQPLTAVASSVDSSDPRSRPEAAVDGTPDTGWIAAPRDLKPTLTVTMQKAHRLTGIELTPYAGAPARAPVEVQVTAGSSQVTRVVPSDGVIHFAHPVRARSVRIHVIRAALRITTIPGSTRPQFLPVGIGEVDLLGRHVPHAIPRQKFRLGCRAGVTLGIDGVPVPMHVSAPMSTALAGDALPAVPCRVHGDRKLGLPPAWQRLAAGRNRVTLDASAVTDPQSIELRLVGQPARPAPVALPVHQLLWTASNRAVGVDTKVAALLVVHENANPGWHATYDGRALTAVTVDGWQQAWLVPAGAHGVVHLRFAPQKTFAIGLLAGAAAALVLIGLAIRRPARRWRARAPAARARPARAHRWLGVAMVVLSLLLLGSVAGLVVAAALLAIAWYAPQRFRGRALVGLAIAASAAVTVLETAATAASSHPLAGSAGGQLLCLVAVGAVLCRCLLGGGRPPRAGEAPQ
ncbi:MAG TPA: alpha-(1-_3)-arabinofuranosyltransferase family protein [Mycobacteriales bacterium]|nr:alpha-(1->3)-arabinofuranosyltransferase family protein [Mycobacteriales bacterium]